MVRRAAYPAPVTVSRTPAGALAQLVDEETYTVAEIAALGCPELVERVRAAMQGQRRQKDQSP
jgi:hypothetical protein